MASGYRIGQRWSRCSSRIRGSRDRDHCITYNHDHIPPTTPSPHPYPPHTYTSHPTSHTHTPPKRDSRYPFLRFEKAISEFNDSYSFLDYLLNLFELFIYFKNNFLDNLLSNTEDATPEASEIAQKLNKAADFVGLADWMTLFPLAKPDHEEKIDNILKILESNANGSVSDQIVESVSGIDDLPNIIIMAMAKDFGARLQSETSAALIYLTVAEIFQVDCDVIKSNTE